MLRDVGKASKRAIEVRDELIGTVAGSEITLLAKKRLTDSFVGPVQDMKNSAQGAAADAIKFVLQLVGVGNK